MELQNPDSDAATRAQQQHVRSAEQFSVIS